METTTENQFADELRSLGAALVGFGDLAGLPADVRGGLPIGVGIAAELPKSVVEKIADYPTAAYYEWYTKLNERLDALAECGAARLREWGYAAVAQTRARVGTGGDSIRTALPHKTVATRAGLGWIGKCALLVTKTYGPRVRLTSILTDAPFGPAQPIDESSCGGCTVCTDICPAGAVSGRLWHAGLEREAFFDAEKCRDMARERAKAGFGGGITICGRCIAHCPYGGTTVTQKPVKSEPLQDKPHTPKQNLV